MSTKFVPPVSALGLVVIVFSEGKLPGEKKLLPQGKRCKNDVLFVPL